MNFQSEGQESAYFGQPGSRLAPDYELVMTKIANFLESHKISLEAFWQSDRNCASATDIVAFCHGQGLALPDYEIINLRSQIFAHKETISVQQFANFVSFWTTHDKQAVSEFLRKRSQMLLDKLQSKQKSKMRPKSSIPASKSSSNFRPISRQSSTHPTRKQSEGRPLLFKNNSRDYLRKFRERQLNRQKELHENIEKNKIDQQYGMLLKMSELNTINKERENKTTYRAYKSAEGIIKVRVFNYNKFEKEISLNEFDTIYKNFKKTTKENKDWTVVRQSTHQKMTDELQNLKNKNSQKSERQQELKNLLVGTVNLTNLLKQQIKIFKEKGILGSDHL